MTLRVGRSLASLARHFPPLPYSPTFPAAKPKPRLTLLPVIKARATNPPRVATVAPDRAAAAAAGPDVVPVPVVRREWARRDGARLPRGAHCSLLCTYRLSLVCPTPPLPPPTTRPLRPAAPLMQNLDDYLTLVGNMYYQQPEITQSTAQWAVVRRTTLGVLTSPVREPSVLGA